MKNNGYDGFMEPTKKSKALSGFILLSLIMALCLAYDTIVAIAVDKEPQGPAACLSCHTFQNLADKKPTFKTESGLLVNPHQFIPHNEKKAENVPNCLDCHTHHPNPPREKLDLSKVEVESCYFSCHHLRIFEKCGKCHYNRKK